MSTSKGINTTVSQGTLSYSCNICIVKHINTLHATVLYRLYKIHTILNSQCVHTKNLIKQVHKTVCRIKARVQSKNKWVFKSV